MAAPRRLLGLAARSASSPCLPCVRPQPRPAAPGSCSRISDSRHWGSPAPSTCDTRFSVRRRGHLAPSGGLPSSPLRRQTIHGKGEKADGNDRPARIRAPRRRLSADDRVQRNRGLGPRLDRTGPNESADHDPRQCRPGHARTDTDQGRAIAGRKRPLRAGAGDPVRISRGDARGVQYEGRRAHGAEGNRHDERQPHRARPSARRSSYSTDRLATIPGDRVRTYVCINSRQGIPPMRALRRTTARFSPQQ